MEEGDLDWKFAAEFNFVSYQSNITFVLHEV
jgi:hypothetical protein